MRLNAVDLHSALAGRWPDLLVELGINPDCLVNRHGPCPACGGKDRFRFDDKDGRGTFICNQCGAGDGFKLVMLVHGWSFSEALHAVANTAGITDSSPPPQPTRTQQQQKAKPEIARPTARVRRLLRTSTSPDLVPDCVSYLQSRQLWPLPAGCTLRAHIAADYCQPGPGKSVEFVGRFPALIGEVRDAEGETVTAHISYLDGGRKLRDHEPRKILSKLTGRRGCAVRLLPLAGDTIGIAEGIETALSASVLHSIPVWSCLNASLLAKFIPPPEVRHVIIFGDPDVAGMKAAWILRDELDGRCRVDLKVPQNGGDWNDVYTAGRT